MNIHFSNTCSENLFLPLTVKKLNEILSKSSLSEEDKSLVAEQAEKLAAKDICDKVLPLNSGKLVIALIKPNEQRSLLPWRNTGSSLVDVMKQFNMESVAIDAASLETSQCGALADGAILASYNFKKSKAKEDSGLSITFLNTTDGQQREISKCKAQADSANNARFIADSPANLMTPELIAKQAEKIARDTFLKLTVLGEKDMQELNMGALLSVSQGSAHEAKLISLEYNHPEAEKTIALVGKGLTFDAGGVNLKPSKGMFEMKYDKSGGAAVLNAIKAIAELKPKINVVTVIPASENVTGANAFKPGDVVTAYNGKTVEIINTDAEGRLILCDALAWTIDQYQPDKIINIATLTGAVTRALGHGIAAVAGNSDDVCQELVKAGNDVDERLWQMPICDVHEELLKSDFADLANVVDSGEASLMNGTVFLREFIGDTPWAAIDIGGTAWRHRGAKYIKGNGASGFGCRLLSQWVLNESL